MGKEYTHKRTSIFVRNIPFNCTDKQLEAAFEDIGPIKECFAVQQKEKQGAGYGFVKFAVPEDAERAASEKDGKAKLGGRKLRVEVARPRSALADRVKKRKVKEAADEYEASFGKGIPDSKKRKEAGGGEDRANADTGREGRPIGSVASNAKRQEAPSAKASAADVKGEAGRDNDDDGPRRRTVILGGFSTSSSQAVVKLVKSLGKQRRKGSSATPVEKIHMPAPIDELPLAELRSHGCRGSMCAVLYTSEAEAAVAVAALHRTTLDAPGKPELWGRTLAGEGASPRRWRVIVRNLPFTTKAEQLMEVMGEVGFVWELNVTADRSSSPCRPGWGAPEGT